MSVLASTGTAALAFAAPGVGAITPVQVTQLLVELLAPIAPSPVSATQVAAELVLALPPQPNDGRVTQILCELIVIPRDEPPCTSGALPIT